MEESAERVRARDESSRQSEWGMRYDKAIK